MGAIRPLVQLVVMATVTVVGLLALDEATEYHGGVESHDGQTTVVFTVDTQGFKHDDDAAAQVLWQLCAGSLDEWDSISSPRHQTGSTYIATIRPSIVEETRRQLAGCLNDLTVDNVLGHVESVTNTTAFGD